MPARHVFNLASILLVKLPCMSLRECQLGIFLTWPLYCLSSCPVCLSGSASLACFQFGLHIACQVALYVSQGVPARHVFNLSSILLVKLPCMSLRECQLGMFSTWPPYCLSSCPVCLLGRPARHVFNLASILLVKLPFNTMQT